ncbi:hypothetical protein LINGRAHAP2_LOCUS29524, partial [Linum grandiflorum]
SDHSPLLLSTDRPANHHPQRGFRFENAWLSEPTLRPFVEDCWSKSMVDRLENFLATCATVLHTWGRDRTLQFHKKIRDKKK